MSGLVRVWGKSYRYRNKENYLRHTIRRNPDKTAREWLRESNDNSCDYMEVYSDTVFFCCSIDAVMNFSKHKNCQTFEHLKTQNLLIQLQLFRVVQLSSRVLIVPSLFLIRNFGASPAIKLIRDFQSTPNGFQHHERAQRGLIFQAQFNPGPQLLIY